MDIRRLGPDDRESVLRAGYLFDAPPCREWTEDFLGKDGHHLLLAVVDGEPAGFISGVEVAHPDKPLEMMLYELGVDDAYRRRGIGRALVDALGALAADAGCSGMWVPVDAGNDAAIAFYLACGAEAPEPAATLWWSLT